MHPPIVVVVSPPSNAVPSPFRFHSALPPLIAYPMGRFQVLFPALAPPSRRVIAEPKLLLKQIRRVCALAAHVGRINLTALVSASALTDALFAPPTLLPFLHPNCSPQRRRLHCVCHLRSLIINGSRRRANSLCVVDELVHETAKELTISSLLVALVNNTLVE